MADSDERVVLDFHNSLLRRSDLKLLEGDHWINDNIIDFCFEYFEREKFNHSADQLSLISTSVTQAVKLGKQSDLEIFLDPLNLSTKNYVFLALNNNDSKDQPGGTHWSLLVYTRTTHQFCHYDSGGSINEDIARQLSYKLQPFVRAPLGKMKIQEMESPKQENGYDCGLYVIAIAEHLCREFCEAFSIPLQDIVTPTAISKKRKQLKDLIFELVEDDAM